MSYIITNGTSYCYRTRTQAVQIVSDIDEASKFADKAAAERILHRATKKLSGYRVEQLDSPGRRSGKRTRNSQTAAAAETEKTPAVNTAAPQSETKTENNESKKQPRKRGRRRANTNVSDNSVSVITEDAKHAATEAAEDTAKEVSAKEVPAHEVSAREVPASEVKEPEKAQVPEAKTASEQKEEAQKAETRKDKSGKAGNRRGRGRRQNAKRSEEPANNNAGSQEPQAEPSVTESMQTETVQEENTKHETVPADSILPLLGFKMEVHKVSGHKSRPAAAPAMPEAKPSPADSPVMTEAKPSQADSPVMPDSKLSQAAAPAMTEEKGSPAGSPATTKEKASQAAADEMAPIAAQPAPEITSGDATGTEEAKTAGRENAGDKREQRGGRQRRSQKNRRGETGRGDNRTERQDMTAPAEEAPELDEMQSLASDIDEPFSRDRQKAAPAAPQAKASSQPSEKQTRVSSEGSRQTQRRRSISSNTVSRPKRSHKINTSDDSRRRIFTQQERYQVYNKSEGHCGICGKFIPLEEYTIDHIIPLSKGGTNDLSNLQACCGFCNKAKDDSMGDEFFRRIENIFLYQARLKYGKKQAKRLKKTIAELESEI